ncbi:MAG TPA: GGDEF domain-containing protein, partial [Acidimicrobiales bacterium]|nr:GGDEF domain-containing protein [Acidimicrobiales bacterium]
MAHQTPAPAPAADQGALPDGADLENLCMRNLLNTPGERVFFKDLESRFLLVSESFVEMYGFGGRAELIGKTDFDIFSNEHASQAFEDEQAIIRSGEPMLAKVERETYHDKPDAWVSTTKLPLRDEQGRVIGTFGICRDVTAQIMAEQALAHQALHDAVTGLPNRVALMDRLSQALLALDRSRTRVALFFIDLDNFKRINDSRGHEAGDRVLVEVARRLTKVSRRGDTVARFGGDEFVILCTGLRADDDVRLIASRVVRAIGRKFVEEGNDLTVTGSIGIVITGDHMVEPGELLQQADIAMYEAKADGRDGFRIFDPSLYSNAIRYHDFDNALRRAIEERQLFLLYQPLFSLEDHSL